MALDAAKLCVRVRADVAREHVWVRVRASARGVDTSEPVCGDGRGAIMAGAATRSNRERGGGWKQAGIWRERPEQPGGGGWKQAGVGVPSYQSPS